MTTGQLLVNPNRKAGKGVGVAWGGGMKPCGGLASHPVGSGDVSSRFMLSKPEV